MLPFGRRKASICAPAVGTPVDPWARLLKIGGVFESGGMPDAQRVRAAGSPAPGQSASVVQVAPASSRPGVLQRENPFWVSISTNAEPSNGALISGMLKK